MLPFGHTAVAYLIAQIPRWRGRALNRAETLLVLFCGSIFDLDLLALALLGIPGALHHYYPGHTPLLGLVWLGFLYIVLRRSFPRRVFFWAGLAMLGHLICDDLSYWFSLCGLEHPVTQPQIFWLFSFDPRHLPELRYAWEVYLQQKPTWQTFLNWYLVSRPLLFYLETSVVLIALVIFLRNRVESAPTDRKVGSG